VLETSPQAIGRALGDTAFTTTDRVGKYLFLGAAPVDAPGGGRPTTWLMLHFGMSGTARYERHPDGELPHRVLVVRFENGARLTYTSVRKLGRVDLAASPDEYARRHGLGPDALSVGREEFVAAFAGSRAKIKGALLDQGRVAGVGNIYADEILFQAGMDPRTPVSELPDDRLRDLWRIMRRVLRTSVRHHADFDELPAGYLIPHRSAGAVCPGGDGRVEKITVVGRPTYLCPDRQRRG
jgi:formamidopyrimidine-DNA glycosylase